MPVPQARSHLVNKLVRALLQCVPHGRPTQLRKTANIWTTIPICLEQRQQACGCYQTPISLTDNNLNLYEKGGGSEPKTFISCLDLSTSLCPPPTYHRKLFPLVDSATMLASTLLTTLLALSAGVSATPVRLARRGYAVKETHDVPAGWTQDAPSHGEQMLKLHLALKQERFAELESQLLAISDPDSPLYGEHLTAEQIAVFTKPHQKTLDAVHAWLAEHNVKDISYSPAQDWITIHVPVSTANYMLDTDYQKYTDSRSGRAIDRVTAWSLPLHLHEMYVYFGPYTCEALSSLALFLAGLILFSLQPISVA